MAYPLSQEYRDLCAGSIEHNLDVLAPLDCDTLSTVEEMMTVARIPYDKHNATHEGDTLDRYSWQPYGNALEVAVLATLCANGDHQVGICRSLEAQSARRIDLRTSDGTMQVKRARMGTFGQLFVSREEVKGEPKWIAYVLGSKRTLYVLDRQAHVALMREVEDRGSDSWKHALDRETDTTGWYVPISWGKEVGVLRELPIPDVVAVPYYDHQTKTVELF